MIITPYSDTSKFASGGPWEPTATNFPACKHFFKCSEATGATTLTDSIGGVVLSGVAITNDGDGSLRWASAYTTIASGAWVAPSTKKILLIWGGKVTSSGGNLTVGSVTANTNRGFRSTGTASGTPAVVGEGAGAVITGTAGLDGTAGSTQLQARALTITWNSATGLAPYDWDGTTWTARAAAGDLNTTPQLSMDTVDASCNFGSGSKPAFVQIFHFTTLPSADEIKAATIWTFSMATTSPYGKYIYPGFKGRT